HPIARAAGGFSASIRMRVAVSTCADQHGAQMSATVPIDLHGAPLFHAAKCRAVWHERCWGNALSARDGARVSAAVAA
ncbi:hypothetical protein, partial [Ralstonia pseudosolanacearum]|uniref:hypothetical protein n=1 Tax=Ralstonia pseudosolanacearum TaxID=1310165 RepID=UPI003CEFE31F